MVQVGNTLIHDDADTYFVNIRWTYVALVSAFIAFVDASLVDDVR